uniref:Si:dkey-1d7.3 n=1 Tax=Myripristis murdjan TaxID=586833 RepID=A0A668A107_9TELE
SAVLNSSCSRAGLPQPVVNASYGPLTVDAPVPPDLLLSGRTILPVILVRQVRSSAPVVKILFHMPTERDIMMTGAKATEGAHCVTAYAFWETREVRGSCLVSPGGFCVAQLKPEPAWFSPASRSGSSSREAGGTEGASGLQGNPVEVYFQSRGDQTGNCVPQDSLQRVGVGGRGGPVGSGTPMMRIGSVNLLRAPPGNPTFLRLRLGGAVVIQTSSKPLKTTEVATFYIFLSSAFTCLRVKMLQSFPQSNHISLSHRGLLEVLQLDFVPRDVSEHAESQMISWRLESPGNAKDVGIMRIYTTQRDYVGLASDILNTAVLTGKTASVPVKILAVEADGAVTDVTNSTSCRSTEEDVLKVSERCDYVYVDGKETRGKSRVSLNFTYSFLSAQLEMNVWMPRLPLLIDVADPELSQIKGWRVPVTTGNRRSTWDSEEEEEMRKGRGCMLQYQHSLVRVLTPFIAQSASEALPDPLTGATSVEHFLGSDWQVDVTNLVRYSLKVADPDVARLQAGVVLQGRAMGTTTLQVLSPLTSSVLAERSIRVLDDKVSVTELGVQLVSGLTLSLQLSPGSNSAIIATATTQEVITQLKQEAVVSCWVQFSDGAVTPLELFDRSIYSLTVSTPDEGVATVRRTPQSTFVVAQGEGEGQGVLVRVELRICEECQKSKRKSKLAVGMGRPPQTHSQPPHISYGNMLDSPPKQDIPKADPPPKKEPPKPKAPKIIESDLIRTFRAMSDLEIGMYALVGVSCVAILAFLLNCASYNLCFRSHKTPIHAAPPPTGDPKDHKHDWVWLGGNSHGAPTPGAPAQVSTLKREAHRPLESHHSLDSIGHRSLENSLNSVSAVVDPMACRSATLLARPQRSEPLHSPTSKRNQVQFTTFTTLDIKHLAALKKNGVDFNWSNQQQQQQHQQPIPVEPQTPLPDMPWPVVKPVG